jgi:hypothetical protein
MSGGYRPTERIAQQPGSPVPPRSSARTEERRTTAPQGSKHRADTTYGEHDDPYPYLSTDVQPARQGNKGYDIAEYDYDDDAPQRPPRSQVRYRQLPITTRVKEEQPQTRISFRGFLFVCGGVLFVAVLIANVIVSYIIPAITDWHNTQLYGYPRIYRTEANAGHGTRTNPLSRYIGINNGGEIEVVEIPEGELSATSSVHIYVVIRIVGADASKMPITSITFSDTNGDGKPDMLVTLGNGALYILYNDGSSFKPQPPK